MARLSDEELAEMRQRFEEAARKGKVTILPPLPLRVRLRLRITYLRDHAAIWLIDRGHVTAGEWLWRITGAW